MKIAKLQKNFADYLYEGKEDILKEINSSKIPSQKRLAIYSNNVFGNFNDVLSSIYEVTKKLVGNDCFESLSHKYNQKYFSHSGNLDDYGSYFPALINNLKKEHKLLYLRDVAKLEWLYHRSYFANDTKPLDIKKLQSLKEEDFFKIKFKLHPSCYLLTSKYPIYKIWNNTQKNSKQKITVSKKINDFVLIARYNFETKISKLSELEYLFLKNLKKSNNIYQTYQILEKQYPEFDIGTLINKFISIGVLSNFKLIK